MSDSSVENLRDVLDRALVADRGIRVPTASRGHAVNLRQRLYTLRTADRETSMKVYPEGSPLHGRSAYDELVITLEKPEECNLLIRRGTPMEVEEL